MLSGIPNAIEVVPSIAIGCGLLNQAIRDVDQVNRRVGDRLSLLVENAATQRRCRSRLIFRLFHRDR